MNIAAIRILTETWWERVDVINIAAIRILTETGRVLAVKGLML